METALDEILVGSGTATIGYRTPLTPSGGTEKKFQEKVALPT